MVASKAGRERAASHGAALTHSREDFFARCDIISLHVRLKPDTQGIITREDFAKMRPDALFVNTSRAGLVQPCALLNALNNGRPGSAAVDVFETEPLTDPADVFISHPNLICMPHIGYVTEDELDMQFSGIFDQISVFAAGEPINTFNSEVLVAK